MALVAQGRPKNIRIVSAGEKLYLALKLSGLSWGAKVGSNHISRSRRWAECGLPKSVNTVLDDIRSGVPLERIDRYAAFFHASAELFLDESIHAESPDFSGQILKSLYRYRCSNPLAPRFTDASLLELFTTQNGEQELFELQETVTGLYRLYFLESGASGIRLGAAIIGEQCDFGLFTSGCLSHDGVRLDFEGRLFCWKNFLHVRYCSIDFSLLGYMMTPDPRQTILIKNRSPFYMIFHTLSGDLMQAPEPKRRRICAVRHEKAEGKALEDGYEKLLNEMTAKPVLSPDDPYLELVLSKLPQNSC
jgi:hypothetical protein